jgi:uncharacterized protein
MQCPKCQSPMHLLADLAEPVHRCEGCKGMWFEIMAHEQLRDQAETIDLVEPAPPAEDQFFDPTAPAPVALLCPACEHYPLIHMVDPQQPHIRFESCKFCYGRFYDPGEFRDFADDEDESGIAGFLKRFAPASPN